MRFALPLLFTALVTFVPSYGLTAEAENTSPASTSSDAADNTEPKAEAKPEASPEPTAEATPEAEKKDEQPQVKHKSPVIAGGLAFFPGFFIHGSGHMYAGHWMKGLGLLTIEAASIGILYAQVSDGTQAIQAIADGTKNGQIPNDLSPAYSRVGVILVSSFAFLYSWLDDMAGAPIAAKEYNRKADEAAAQAGSQGRLLVAPRHDGGVMAYTRSF